METIGYVVSAPMFISSRLMGALRIDGVGTIHVAPESRDDDGCLTWRYIVEDTNGNVLCERADITDGAGNDVNAAAVTESLMGFMQAAADAYEYNMRLRDGDARSENSDLFPPAMMEWCYQNYDEISSAMYELTTPSE